jgi:hypothetical protein
MPLSVKIAAMRPGRRYPVMPPGDCYSASVAPAQVYPELRYAEGTRTFTVHVQPDGHAESSAVAHAWNVTRHGEIWDSTLDPVVLAAARLGEVAITYAETDGTS